MSRVLIQGEIESQILAIVDELEEQTYLYSTLSETAAEAEADYKRAASSKYVQLVSLAAKISVVEKQARVDAATDEEFRTWKIAEARRQASREALLSLRARLDALRTLSANVRHQT